MSSNAKALSVAILAHVKSTAGSSAAVETAFETLKTAFAVSEADITSLTTEKDLSDVWSAGVSSLGLTFTAPAAAVSGETSALEKSAKFVQYLEKVTEKGYFKDLEPGTDAYESRYAKLLEKFKEKFGSEVPAADSPAASSTASNENLATSFKDKGNKLLVEKKYDEAIECYSNAIEASSEGPNTHIFYSNRAAAHLHKLDYEAAVEDCGVSTTLSPEYAKAHARAAQASFGLERFEDAQDSAERTLEIEPSNAIAQGIMKKLKSNGSLTAGAGAGAGAGAAAGMGGMADMMRGMDPSMLAGLQGMAGGGGGGMPDMASMMNNPQMMQAAQSMMQNPQMMQMAQQMMSDPNAMANMMGMMGKK